MGADIFLKIDGIPGESFAKDHKDEIDILSWSWGASQQASMHLGGGAGKGRSTVNDIVFTKGTDMATNKLYTACLTGQHIKEMTLSCNKAAGDGRVEFIKTKLESCYITSISTSASSGAEYMENFSVTFAKVSQDYVKQDDTGKKTGNNNFTYDVKSNA